ncbi:hypothetical protein [Prolixibacter bellariivorans]|uniref:hypothetical protein n=1 Tax=Prolixibacter bellariivorans TaxID=314319 RepID=UPI001298F42F|nr:hypothetical protein [Prolixibacter bellariivorans]
MSISEVVLMILEVVMRTSGVVLTASDAGLSISEVALTASRPVLIVSWVLLMTSPVGLSASRAALTATVYGRDVACYVSTY